MAKKILISFSAGVLLLIGIIALTVKLLFGERGEAFPNFSTPPVLTGLEVVAELPVPPGNIAVSSDSRIFLTVHPESRPQGFKLGELVGGKLVPFPDKAAQSLFKTPLGIRLDGANRLWVLDHGMNGLQGTRLLAFDIQAKKVVHDYSFPSDVAGSGSFLNDLQVDPAGEKIYIADTSVFARSPALIVYDSIQKRATRLLEGHPALNAENYFIQNPQRDMVFLGGIFVMRPAVDSIVLDRQGEWLYLGAMTATKLYRVHTRDLMGDLSESQLGSRVEIFSDKPQTDGATIDDAGNIFLTDVENRAIALVSPERVLKTAIQDPRIRWPDGLSFGPDSWVYFTDSNLGDVILRSRSHMNANAPYFVFRFKALNPGKPGQ